MYLSLCHYCRVFRNKNLEKRIWIWLPNKYLFRQVSIVLLDIYIYILCIYIYLANGNYYNKIFKLQIYFCSKYFCFLGIFLFQFQIKHNNDRCYVWSSSQREEYIIRIYSNKRNVKIYRKRHEYNWTIITMIRYKYHIVLTWKSEYPTHSMTSRLINTSLNNSFLSYPNLIPTGTFLSCHTPNG